MPSKTVEMKDYELAASAPTGKSLISDELDSIKAKLLKNDKKATFYESFGAGISYEATSRSGGKTLLLRAVAGSAGTPIAEISSAKIDLSVAARFAAALKRIVVSISVATGGSASLPGWAFVEVEALPPLIGGFAEILNVSSGGKNLVPLFDVDVSVFALPAYEELFASAFLLGTSDEALFEIGRILAGLSITFSLWDQVYAFDLPSTAAAALSDARSTSARTGSDVRYGACRLFFSALLGSKLSEAAATIDVLLMGIVDSLSKGVTVLCWEHTEAFTPLVSDYLSVAGSFANLAERSGKPAWAALAETIVKTGDLSIRGVSCSTIAADVRSVPLWMGNTTFGVISAKEAQVVRTSLKAVSGLLTAKKPSKAISGREELVKSLVSTNGAICAWMRANLSDEVLVSVLGEAAGGRSSEPSGGFESFF